MRPFGVYPILLSALPEPFGLWHLPVRTPYRNVRSNYRQNRGSSYDPSKCENDLRNLSSWNASAFAELVRIDPMAWREYDERNDEIRTQS